MSAVAAQRRAAAVARITAAIDGTTDCKVISARLGGVSRQRVFQLLRWLERQTDSSEARMFREALRMKREFFRAEKKKRLPGMAFCRARNAATGHMCVLAEGHACEHYNDYRQAVETWASEREKKVPGRTFTMRRPGAKALRRSSLVPWIVTDRRVKIHGGKQDARFVTQGGGNPSHR